MIFVKRAKCPKSLDLSDATSPAAKELAAAKALPEPPPGSFFKAYAGDDVRQALIDMFHGKCAYCETDTAAGNDADIEHYRPKGGVSDAATSGVDHPGYWWLAMEWSNLVLSCAHCNQERRQLGLSPDMSVEEIKRAIERNDRRTTGKKNAFPTANGKWVTSHTKKVAREKPLLLDPTATDPEPLFEWVVADGFSTIRPRSGDPRADKTWRVLGLNRRRLTEARFKRAGELMLLKRHVHEALKDLQDAETDEGARIAKRAVLRELEKLRDYCAPDKPYAALARSYRKEIDDMVAATL